MLSQAVADPGAVPESREESALVPVTEVKAHWGVTCHHCKTSPLVGDYYSCRFCTAFQGRSVCYCAACHSEAPGHGMNHEMAMTHHPRSTMRNVGEKWLLYDTVMLVASAFVVALFMVILTHAGPTQPDQVAFDRLEWLPLNNPQVMTSIIGASSSSGNMHMFNEWQPRLHLHCFTKGKRSPTSCFLDLSPRPSSPIESIMQPSTLTPFELTLTQHGVFPSVLRDALVFVNAKEQRVLSLDYKQATSCFQEGAMWFVIVILLVLFCVQYVYLESLRKVLGLCTLLRGVSNAVSNVSNPVSNPVNSVSP